MRALTLVFDPRCPPCRRWARWAAQQPALVRLDLLSARSTQARERHASLAAPEDAHGALAMVSERGEVWRGEHALRMGLWALRAHRAASYDPRTTAAALAEHDAALLEHRIRPPASAAGRPSPPPPPAPAPLTRHPEPRSSLLQGVVEGLLAGIATAVVAPVLLVGCVLACLWAYAHLGGALGALAIGLACLVLLGRLLRAGARCH